VIQSAFWFKRRSQLGLSGGGVQGGSYSVYAKDELLPEVKDLLAMLPRRRIG
jgi:hypothetical protein